MESRKTNLVTKRHLSLLPRRIFLLFVVMRAPGRILAGVIITIVGLAIFLGATSKSNPPVTMTVMDVAETEDCTHVTVEFLRHDTAARFDEKHQLQLRVAGRWQLPRRSPELNTHLFWGTNSQQLVFHLPRQTEACRFLLAYRVGSRPYCQAYAFLSRRGALKKFPAISKAILKCVPQHPWLRHVTVELTIPTVMQNNALQRTGGPPEIAGGSKELAM